jgi:hypothetical protein
MGLDSMRADYRLVRRWWADAEGWSVSDLQDADAQIKAAVESGDDELIACWANWLAGIAQPLREQAARFASFEQQVRNGKAA